MKDEQVEEKELKIDKSTKDVIYPDDIIVNTINPDIIYIGGSLIDLGKVSSIVLQYTKQIDDKSNIIYYANLRYKSNQYDFMELEKNAYDKLIFILELYKSKEKQAKMIAKENYDNHLVKEKTLNKNLREVNKNYRRIIWFLIFIIIILGLIPNLKAEEINFHNQQMEPKSFPYTFVYEVNIDKCQPLKAYDNQNKFSYWDIKNSKLVAEFPHRPGELIFVSPDGDMYVFTDTEDRCLKFQKRFIDEMIKQNEEEENRYQGDE